MVVRCRPISEKEIQQGFKQVVDVNEVSGTIVVTSGSSDEPSNVPKDFTYDAVFAQGSKQLDVYNQAARPIVDNVLEGYNGRITESLT